MIPTCPLSCEVPRCQNSNEVVARGGSNGGGGGDGGGGGGAEREQGALEGANQEVAEKWTEEVAARREREAMAEAAEQLQRQMMEVLL